MSTSVATRQPASSRSWGVYLIPLAVLVTAAGMTLVLYRDFEAILGTMAPAAVAACCLAVLAGIVQRNLAGRRARRRALSYLDVSRIVEQLARGEAANGARDVGRSWRTIEAARLMAATLPDTSAETVRRALLASGAWELAAQRVTGTARKWERVRALHDLGWLGAWEAIHLVERHLSDADDDMAWAAIMALGGMEEPGAYEALLDQLPTSRFAPSRIAQVLETSRNPRPLPALMARSGGANPTTLFWVAYLLGQTGEPAALEPLLRLSWHPDPDVRASAAEALGRTGTRDGVPRLLEMLEGEAWFVRLHACRALGDLGAQEAVSALRRATQDEDWWVRTSALDALARLRRAAA